MSEDFPDLSIIVNHFGGGVAGVIELMDYYVELFAGDIYRDRPPLRRPWRDYFGKLYFNMAGRGPGVEAIQCALTCIQADKLMFGSDWPPNFESDAAGCKSYIEDIRALPISESDIRAMLGDNAARLLGIPAP